MALVSIPQFLKRFNAACAPHEHTVRRWIDKGSLPGVKFGSRYYVDEEALEAKGNPLVAKVLRSVSRSA